VNEQDGELGRNERGERKARYTYRGETRKRKILEHIGER